MSTVPFFEVSPTVFIAESPSPDDVFYGHKEGEALSGALRLAHVANSYTAALDKDTLHRALYGFSIDLKNLLHNLGTQDLVPIIHISAHGNEDGIGLSSGELVLWSELREMLLEFHSYAERDVGRGLCLTALCLSSCSGAHARRMFDLGPPHPCLGLVGPNTAVDWSDSLTAFITFYHHLLYKDAPVQDAVARMNHAAGLETFFAYFPDHLEARFREYGLFLPEGMEEFLKASAPDSAL